MEDYHDHKTILSDIALAVNEETWYTVARYRGSIRLLCSEQVPLLCGMARHLAECNPGVLV
jgi:hypothetical protein